MAQTAKYSVEIRDQYGRLVTTLLRPQNKQFSVYRNRPGSCQFTLDLFDPQATVSNLALNQYDIVFRRLGTPVFAGQISYIHPIIDGDRKQVEVIATGYFDLLDQRYVTSDFPGYDALHSNLPFAATDLGQIAWNLITYTQFPLVNDGAVKMQGVSPSLCQSFVSQGTANVTDLKILLANTTATGNLIVAIYPDQNGVPGPLPIANSTKTIAVSGIGAATAWYDIPYTVNLPALTKGQTYWVRAYLDTAQSGSNGISWYYLNNNYYLSGRAYSPENPGLFTASQDLQFFVLLDDNSFQMTKNTYLGITQGSLPTSFTLAPTYAQFKKIKACIEDLSNTNNGIDIGFSVTIDPVTNFMTKSFSVFYPRQGVDNTNLNFIYPGNIKKVEKPKDGKTMINEVAMRGQGYGTQQTVVTVLNAASIQAYGLRQDVENQADVPDTATLTSLGNELIRVRKDPLDLPNVVLDGNVSPHIGDYNVGDLILIQIYNAGAANIIGAYRIERLDVKVDDDDMEECSLTLSVA